MATLASALKGTRLFFTVENAYCASETGGFTFQQKHVFSFPCVSIDCPPMPRANGARQYISA
jgi:hypothetical protein